jgi:hypothetical protein
MAPRQISRRSNQPVGLVPQQPVLRPPCREKARRAESTRQLRRPLYQTMMLVRSRSRCVVITKCETPRGSYGKKYRAVCRGTQTF